jgi:hypothetical protein
MLDAPLFFLRNGPTELIWVDPFNLTAEMWYL